MRKSKDKGLKNAKGQTLSARPTFEFDIDLEERPSPMRIPDDDDQSISSSASKKMIKKVKNLMSRSFHKAKNVDLDDRSVKKKSFMYPEPPASIDFVDEKVKKSKPSSRQSPHPPVTIDFFDAGPDDRSTRGGKTKKKKKKGSQSALGESRSGSITNGFDDDMSSRSGMRRVKKSKKKKKKPKSDDDDDSVETTRSSRSTRSKKPSKKGRAKSIDMLGASLDLDNSSQMDQRRMNEMEIENTALLEETATIRRQLNEAEKALRKSTAEQKPQQANFDQIRELEMAQTESRELKIELEEYEDAVIEKDELIQKLTEAVDAQLDKVELLDIKLVRAEDEFCKMEEEMKEMEDVIEDLRSRSPGEINQDNDNDANSANNGGRMTDVEILEELDKRERNIEKKEEDLLEKENYVLKRETLIEQQNEELKMRRSALLKQKSTFGSEIEINKDDSDALKGEIEQLEAENNDLMEEIECLRRHETETTEHKDSLAHQRDEELKSLRDNFDKKMADTDLENETLREELDGWKRGNNSENDDLTALRNNFDKKMADSKQENKILRQELDCLKQKKNSEDGELKLLRDNFDKKLENSKLENKILRQELDGLKQRKNSENEALRQQIEELMKQKTHVEATSRQMRRMESMRMLEPENPKALEDDGEFGLEVEVEIAELREKIVNQEEHSRKLKKEIATHLDEIEEIKQELQERELDLKGLENQLSATKETSTKKMKQKDETISFMQSEMMRIMQEKQEVDKELRGNNLNNRQTQLMESRAEDDAAEKAKLESINNELRRLDDENRVLEEELNKSKYDSSLLLKEKESVLLELQEELSDVKWELGAREKGADYVTLLKDRKDRKNQLNKARRELKVAEEKILELELEQKSLLSNKKDLEKELESVNKEGTGEQMSGLKRQIKSLKQHNVALERKLDTESRDSEDKLGENEVKISILEYELQKLRNPAQTAIRGVVSGFIPGFGRRNDEGDIDNALDTEVNNESTLVDDEAKSAKSAKIANTDSTAKDGKAGKIWSLFSPRNQLPKTANRNKHIGPNLSSYDSMTPGDDDVGTGDNERDSMIESTDGFEETETL